MNLGDSYLTLPRASDIRGARAALDWTQMELAYKCGVNIATITSIEKEKSKPSKELLETIAKVFAEEDIYFMPSGGYKVEKDIVKIYEGVDSYIKVLEDVYKTCASEKKELLLLGNDDSRSSEAVNTIHTKIYEAEIPHKYLIAGDDDYVLGPVDEYRKIDRELFLSREVVLMYGNKTMFCAGEGDYTKDEQARKAKIIVIQDKGMTEQLKAYFYRLWNRAEKIEKSTAKQVFFRK